jgi:predicted DCC family thiol-disulfide oxidoreductase YuxK
MEKEKIVFFDGVCNLCTASVQFLLRTNRKKNLKFAPLQSDYFHKQFPNHPYELESILYFVDGKLFAESTAVILICRELIFPLPLILVLLVIPRFFRDLVYRMIARSRYRIFGKKETCYLPTPELLSRFYP